MGVLTHVRFDPEDLEAYRADVRAIFLRYGVKPQPHEQAAFDAEMARAQAALGECMVIIGSRKAERRGTAHG